MQDCQSEQVHHNEENYTIIFIWHATKSRARKVLYGKAE